MKTFIAVTSQGTPSHSISSPECEEYYDGYKLNDLTLRDSGDIPPYEIIQSYYYKNGWIKRDESPGKHYEWSIGAEVWSPRVDLALAQRSVDVNRLREEKLSGINSGIQYSEEIFDNNNKTRGNLNELVNMINSGISLPEGFTFRTKDNINIQFTEDDVKTLFSVMVLYKNQCFEASWAIKGRIEQLETVEEIEAFDITVGWPE